MIPVELELRNFLAYRDPAPLNFQGIHVACLAGENGAGKSSLLDAITWALWGKARSNSPDDLIHQGQTEMRVALTFTQGEDRFRVIRQRKTGKRGSSLLEFQAWNSEVDGWQGIAEATIRETQAKIDGLIRLDYETFVNSAFLLQGRADEFTTKTPAQRKQVLANILGLSVWDKYEELAKQRISTTRAEIERLDGRLEEIERELAQREDYELEMKSSELMANEKAAELEAAEKEWASLEGTRSELVALQRQIDDLTRRITSRERELSEAQNELKEADAQADQAAVTGALDEVRKALAQLEPLQIRLKELDAEREKLTKEAANLRGANNALAPQTEPIKKRIEALQGATEPVCPTCGQPLTDEHRQDLIGELDIDVAERRKQYRENRSRVTELETILESLSSERKSLNHQLAEQAALQKRAGELETMLTHADEAKRRADGLRERLKRWSDELDQDQKQRSTLEEQAQVCEKRLRAASIKQKEIDELRQVKRLADERVGGARQKLTALVSFEGQRQERLRERDQKAEDLSLFEDLRLAFSKRGVPAMIIETAVPELERAATELLSRMTDGRMHLRIETQREIKTGELREALDIIISDELGSRPYELYSGGEAFRIDFALRIALSRLLARRAGAQLRSLYIDEGFGTQDTRGREHLVAAINSIQDDFDLILVITHIAELKEAFPVRIEVTKTAEGSVYQIA
ncbi:MAG: SMC family ATPase [Anaerolineales bacterium]|nr:MAG: SMC family ATPase [Anaerolineales bacterium]